MRVIVTAGGTMGHINPALAIIEEFKKNENKLEVLYIGTHNRMEKDIIPKLGIEYLPIKIYGFSKNILLDVKNVFYVKEDIKVCKEVMKKFKPDVVIGVGGYVTYPVIKAAHSLKIKVFIHEQNSIPGKSNKMIAKYADLIGITFKNSIDSFPKNKVIYTGHPCGAMALNALKIDKTTLGFTKGKKLVTIVAGSLGSGSLNDKFQEFLLGCGKANYEICYICGKAHYESFVGNKEFPHNVKVFSYLDNLPGLIKVSDLVISRAGAGSLAEILALEIPAIVIPSPNVSNNHQYFNAKDLEEKGCIYLLEEKQLTLEVIKEVIELLLKDTTKRLKMRNAMHDLDTKDSSKIIYKAIKKMLDD